MAEKKEEEQKKYLEIEEMYLTTAEMAAFLGKSERTIQLLTKDGILKKKKIPKVRGGRYGLGETTRAFIEYQHAKVKSKAVSKNEKQLKKEKLQAEAELKKSQKEMHELKTDIFRGKYAKVEEVERDYKKFFTIFRKFAETIPANISMLIGSRMEPREAREVEKEIADEIKDLLRKFTLAAISEEDDEEEGSE